MRLYYLIPLTLCLTAFSVFAHTGPTLPVSVQPYLFEENNGQLPGHVKFRAAMGSKYLYIEEDGLKWHLRNENDLMALPSGKHDQDHKEIEEDLTIRHHVFKMHFKNANKGKEFFGIDSSYSVKNYLKGREQKDWAGNVHSYKEINVKNIYDKVDFKFYQQEGNLKYDFIVQPGGDPFDIQMEFQDVDTLFIKNEQLYIVTSVDTLIERAPVAYQTILGIKQKVSCRFLIKDSTVSFYLSDAYNPNYTLVIDPELVFSTYTGSQVSNWGMTATPGLNDEMFTGGIAFGTGYPTTSGAFQQRYNQSVFERDCDVVISKFSADGTRLEYSTYLGGDRSEVPHSLIVNNQGQLVVYGTTSSRDFPVNSFSYQSDFQGGQRLINPNDVNGINFVNGADIFIAVISENGSSLVGSTFMGGSATDGINNVRDLPYNYGDQFRGEVIVDNDDNIYVASSTQSVDFPTSLSAYSTQSNGRQDACIFALNSNCTALLFSTYLGGAGDDAAYTVKRASNGEIFVAGGTTSGDFPVSTLVLNNSYQGGDTDGFVTRFNPPASNIVASTFIGTNEIDQVYLLTLDFEENIYIAGHSTGNMPVSSGVYSNRNSGQFLQILNKGLSTVEKSTIFGTGSGEVDLSLTALMVDTCQRIFLSGWGGIANNTYRINNGFTSQSTTRGLPLTADAFQTTTTGSDFYFFVLEKEFSSLLYATFFGRQESMDDFSADHVDGGTSRFSDKGIIYQAVCAGCGGFSDFPTTPGAWSRTNNAVDNAIGLGACNLAAIKFDFQLSALEANIDLRLDTFGCAPYNAEFINRSIGADEYFWDFGDSTTSTEANPTHLYDSIGQYDVLFVAISNSSCLDPDTLEITIEIILAEPPNKEAILICGEPSVTLSSDRTTPGAKYTWNTGSTEQSIEVFESGKYSVTATESNCVFVDSFDVTIINPRTRLSDTTLCGKDEFTLRLDQRATNINWSSNVNGGGTEVVVRRNGLYTVEYDIGQCTFRDSAAVEFPAIPVIHILGADSACQGETVTLSIQNKSPAVLQNFQWSTGATTPTIEVTQSGTYSITVVSDSSCTYKTEKFVYIIPGIEDIDIPDTLLCRDNEYIIDLTAYDSVTDITWNDGSKEPLRRFTTAGNYSFTISTACQVVKDEFSLEFSPFGSEEQPFYIPNTFTPNRDELNDVFRMETANEMEVLNYQMDVFDRWGNKLFTSKDHTEGWDGSFKGSAMDLGIFTYIIELDYFVCEEPRHEKVSADIAISDQ